jgi:hypothetical protein
MSESDPVREPRSSYDEFDELCQYLGLALITWQDIEHCLFKIFLRMLKLPIGDVEAVVYYSVESFDLRRKMVERMAYYLLQPRNLKKQRTEWCELNKLIKDANDYRNRLAHYCADYYLLNQIDNPDGSVSLEVSPHSLRPAQFDSVRKLLGHTPDKVEFNIESSAIKKYIIHLRALRGRMDLFHVSISAHEKEGPGLPAESHSE